MKTIIFIFLASMIMSCLPYTVKNMDLFELPESGKFQWGLHGHDEWYTEIRQGSIIYREFTDDCVMKYRVDREGKPIVTTFRWVIKTHSD